MMRFFSSRSDSERSTPPQPPLRPPPPIAKRLNRNALTVAAVIMGMTVLTAIVLLKPGEQAGAGSATRPATDESPPPPSRPVFLDEPVRTSLRLGDTANAVERPGSLPRQLETQQAAEAYPQRLRDVDPYAAPDPLPYAPPAMMPGADAVSPRVRAYRAALASPSIIGAATVRAAGEAGTPGSTTAGDEEQRLIALGDSIMRAAVGQAPSATRPSAGDATQAGAPASARASSRQRAFLAELGDARGSSTPAQLEPAASPFTLHAGTLIPGILVTGINSDLPGDIVGQVSRDVYDSRTQRILLIPRGSRLMGTYDDQVAAGQGRLLIAWTRLILPDGRSMRLPGLALKDAAGQTGAKDKVDRHWRRVFGNALLLSAIGAGVQLSQPQQSNVLAPPSAGQVGAGALGQELSNVALEILRRGMDVAPTITIRAGQTFNVFLNGDLVFDGPYEEKPHGER